MKTFLATRKENRVVGFPPLINVVSNYPINVMFFPTLRDRWFSNLGTENQPSESILNLLMLFILPGNIVPFLHSFIFSIPHSQQGVDIYLKWNSISNLTPSLMFTNIC